MKFVYENTEFCHTICDENNMATRRPYYEGEIISLKDSMINTSECYWAFENGWRFLLGIKLCIKEVYRDKRIELYRYPEKGYCGDFSRDQLTKLLFALTFKGDITYRNYILKLLRWRISLKFTQTIDFWLWQKSMLYNSKIISFIHGIWSFFAVLLPLLWTRLWFYICGVKFVSESSYEPNMPTTKLQRFARKSWTHFPVYAVDKYCWQHYCLPDTPIKKFVGYCVRKLSDKTNLVHIMLLGGSVSKDQVESFKPYLHSRWSAWLININRVVQKMPEGMYTENLKDVAMLQTLYKATQYD